MIVKVQIALNQPLMRGRGLVYAEDRAHMSEQALPDAVVKALGSEKKGFFEASWTGKTWDIGPRMDPQAW